jgi:hypothetical protein
MTRFALVIAVALAGGACKKQEQKAPLAEPAVPAMPADEVQRSTDACKAYVDRACACATKVPEAVKPCELARALPDAVRLSLEVATYPDSKPDIVRQAQAGVRKTVKECIEQTAKLPALGCP